MRVNIVLEDTVNEFGDEGVSAVMSVEGYAADEPVTDFTGAVLVGEVFISVARIPDGFEKMAKIITDDEQERINNEYTN